MTTSTLLVGRDTELAAIDRVVEAGTGRALVLAGPAGVGKTRLARAALDRARDRGRAAFWIPASRAAATIPFAAIAHLAPDVDTSDPLRLLHGTMRRIAESAPDGRPVVLGVDDAHDLDDASATLVGHVVAAGAVTVVATTRPDRTAPGPVTTLWKEEHGERLEVGPLGRDDTRRLVTALVGGPVESVAHEQLWRLTEGNPLYLHELVRGGLATGALAPVGGVWCWTGRVRADSGLGTLVGERVRTQTPAVRDAVDLVAFGEPLGAELLARAGVPPDAVEEAEAQGLLRTGSEGPEVVVRLAHPLFGEVARQEASPLRRREVSRRLARAALAGPDVRGDDAALRAAVWQLEGGLVITAPVLVTGARRAVAALDGTLGGRLAAAAVAAGGGVPAERVLATAHLVDGDQEAAERVLCRLAEGPLPDETRAEVAAVRAATLAVGLDRPDEAETVLTTAEARVRDGREHLAAQRVHFLAYSGHPVEAVRIARAVLATPGARDTAVMKSLTWGGRALQVRGRHAEAHRMLDRARALGPRLDERDWSLGTDEVLASAAGVLLGEGRLDEADRLVDAGAGRAHALGGRMGASRWAMWRADLALARGLPRTALGHLREAHALGTTTRHPLQYPVLRLGAVLRARALALVGEPGEAAASLAEADRRARPTNGVLDVWGGSSAAWVAVARGDVAGGIDVALADAERARRDGQDGWALLALHQAVRFGGAGRALAGLRALEGSVDGMIAPLVVRQAEAAVAGSGGDLDAVADGFAALGLLLLAADAAGQAARAHRATGDVAPSVASARRARRLHDRCEGARTPALALLAGTDVLSGREQRIADLAARGLRNRDIADRLVVSVRTVDNALHQIYGKLAVSGREDLVTLFGAD